MSQVLALHNCLFHFQKTGVVVDFIICKAVEIHKLYNNDFIYHTIVTTVTSDPTNVNNE